MTRLEHLLEDPDRVGFYDLLGGLADNLLTIGGHAGTFLACDGCGYTFTTKDECWKCSVCGQTFELKFKPVAEPGSPFETIVRVTGLSKPRMNPHWYFDNENWSVAEFLTQLLRMNPGDFFRIWLSEIGIHLSKGELETCLCWPRFKFGRKTIQPDFVVCFENDFVLFEFKRPSGGTVPAAELAGQVCFAGYASDRLGRKWHLVIVPGPNRVVKGIESYAADAIAGLDEAERKWGISRGIESSNQFHLVERMRVLGWQQMIERSIKAIENHFPDGWAKRNALMKLGYWLSRRRELNLLH